MLLASGSHTRNPPCWFPFHPGTSNVETNRLGVVGLLVCLTGALGNAVVTANLQNLQGTFGAWSTEIAWLPAVSS